MLFNVIGYDNQVIGQVEASNAVEAWTEAGKRFENVLDIREVEEKLYLRDIKYGRTPRGSLIQLNKLTSEIHLEITNPEDMEIISNLITRAGLHPRIERKKVYSPRDKGYVYALVIDIVFTKADIKLLEPFMEKLKGV